MTDLPDLAHLRALHAAAFPPNPSDGTMAAMRDYLEAMGNAGPALLARLERLEKVAEATHANLVAIAKTIEEPNPAITDTIWHRDGTTLLDAVQESIDELAALKGTP